MNHLKEPCGNPPRKRAYIAGPVSGKDKTEVRKAFADAAMLLKAAGYCVINPFETLSKPEVWNEAETLLDRSVTIESWQDCMRLCLVQIASVDEMFMLPDWAFSRGAKIEKQIAEGIGIPVKELHEL